MLGIDKVKLVSSNKLDNSFLEINIFPIWRSVLNAHQHWPTSARMLIRQGQWEMKSG